MKLVFDKENYYWTDHVRRKMQQYRLVESRVKRVLRHPKRVEVGVAEDTVASMQPAGSKKHPFEIWVMWQQKNKNKSSKNKFNVGGQLITIISAWRYPGVSPLREPPPIPDDAWEELRRIKKA
ncbi:MAG TPA: hypothetical protein P5089_02065 [Candidatus Portnoybacteria bacterium]|nr:hypothetical protein [Candidatus Portnoybacteria bacterium]